MTFGIKTEGAQKAEKDIDGVAAASKKAEESQEGLNDSIESGTGALDKMTGGAVSAFKGVVSGVKKAVIGMKTLKGAVIATGVGALVVIVASLVSYFTQTKKGAEVLQVATAALGAVFGKITDVLSYLGGALVSAFQSPQEAIETLKEKGMAIVDWVGDLWEMYKKYLVVIFEGLKVGFYAAAIAAAELFTLGLADTSGLQKKLEEAKENVREAKDEFVEAALVVAEPFVEAFEIAKTAVIGFVKEVGEAVKSASALEKRAIRLADAQRNLSVEFAQTRQKMTDLKLVSEDVTKTFEERIAATEEAGALEQELADKSLALAQEAVNIKREQNALSESTAEDLQALADLEIALSNAQIESAGKQTEILMKVNSLYKEQEAAIKATEDAEQQRITDLIARQSAVDDIVDAGRAREIQKIKDHWIEQKRLAALEGQVLVGAADAQRIQIAEVNDKYDKLEIKEAKLTAQQKLGIASNLIGSLMALDTALAGSSEKEQKKAFQRNKKMGIVSALINTAGAIIGAINPAAGGIALPVGLPNAIAAAASGAAQIATIAKSRFASPDTTAPPPPNIGGGGGASAAAASSTAPQLDLSFLGEGSGGSIQAYVISEQVTNQQQADQIVTDQTTL